MQSNNYNAGKKIFRNLVVVWHKISIQEAEKKKSRQPMHILSKKESITLMTSNLHGSNSFHSRRYVFVTSAKNMTKQPIIG